MEVALAEFQLAQIKATVEEELDCDLSLLDVMSEADANRREILFGDRR